MLLQLHELHYNLGCLLQQQGDGQMAIRHYRNALKLCPDYALAHLNLGALLSEQGQWDAAISHYQTAIRLQPGKAESYHNLAIALYQQGNFAGAVQAWQQAIALSPHWAVLYQHQGQAYFVLGQVELAIAAYQKAIDLEPTLIAALHPLAVAWQYQGQHERAIACFQRVIELDPTHVEAYGDWGYSALALGQLNNAMVCFQHVVASDRTFITAYCLCVNQQIEQQFDRVPSSDLLTQARLACCRFLQALLPIAATNRNFCSSDVNFETALHYLADTCLHWGDALMQYGESSQYRRAEALYQRALFIRPYALDLLLRLSYCLSQQGRLNAAILTYHLALNRFPDSATLHFQLGQLLEQQGNFSQALHHYHQITPLLPHSPTSPLPHSPTPPLPHSPTPPLPHSPTPPPPCPGLNCTPCLKQITGWFEPLHLGQGLFRLSIQHPLPEDTLPPVQVLPNGRIWTMPQQNDWMVCRAIAVFESERLLPACSQSYPGGLPNCQHPEVNLPRLDAATLPPVVAIEGSVAALTGLSANIYFHWMIDILPRLYFLQQAGWNLEAIDWFLINHQNYAFQQETLRLVGVPESKILQSDRHPHITASQLIVPPASPLGWAHPTTLQFLRQTFLPQLTSCPSAGQSYPERIYITRSQARHRRVLNEAEGGEYLSKMGFVAYALESLSVLEQVALFHHAQVILAPHGSGLTNLAFCQPGTTVVELFSPQYIRPYYWVISRHLRLNHYYLVSAASACRPLRQLMYPSPLTEDLWIDWSQAKTALEKILSPTVV